MTKSTKLYLLLLVAATFMAALAFAAEEGDSPIHILPIKGKQICETQTDGCNTCTRICGQDTWVCTLKSCSSIRAQCELSAIKIGVNPITACPDDGYVEAPHIITSIF